MYDPWFVRLTGRCADGKQRGGGRRVHIMDGNSPSLAFGRALCGAKPGRTSAHGFVAVDGPATCTRCLRTGQPRSTPNELEQALNELKEVRGSLLGLARRELEEICELTGPGGDDTPFGRVESVISELAMVREELAIERDRAHRYSHAILESGVRPGLEHTCRCEDCRKTAIEMDDAGWLDGVAQSDRWWRR